jgi:hypothetical protein
VVIEFHLVFPFSWAPPLIFSMLLPVPLTIITIEPCEWNAEFQHFVPRFNRISLLCGYHSRRGLEVKGGPKIEWRPGDFQHISVSYLQCRSWGFYVREICQVIQTRDQNQGHTPVFGGKERLKYKTTKLIHSHSRGLKIPFSTNSTKEFHAEFLVLW